MKEQPAILTAEKPRSARERWAEIVGWCGAGAVLLAYGLLTADVLLSDEVAYQALNVTGALALGWLAYVKTAWPSVALNLIWATIGTFGFIV